MPKKKWTVVKIPSNSVVYEKILSNNNMAAWRTLEQMALKEEKSKEDQAHELLHKFIDDLIRLYPSKEEHIRLIVPFFSKGVIKNKKIDNSYFEALEEIINKKDW